MILALHEILSTHKWMMRDEALDTYRQMIQGNILGRVSLEAFQKKQPYCLASISGKDAMMRMNAVVPMAEVYGEDGERKEVEVDSFVSIIPVCGPITRNGGACSYGSIDTRDMIMAASSDEDCAGIILYINTEGGSCYAIPDYKYGIEYAHQHGKKVIAFVDGMCASCGMYLASMCDKRYYMNPLDQVGSIGVMTAFWTNKDGDKDKYTDAQYHVLYAEQSTHKNKWYRDAAEGDYKALQDDLNKTCEEFHADIKAACPNVKDVHLTGEVFNAKDVEGILMDGRNTIPGIIHELLAEATTEPSTSRNIENSNHNTTINMENYPLINAACGLNAGEMVVTEEGTHMNAELLDALEAKLSAQEQEIAELKEAASHNQEAIDAAVAKANEEHTAAVETLNTEHAEALQQKEAEMATVTEELSSVKEDLKGAQEALATAEQTIADKDAQIAELSNDPGNEPQAGAAPANNGEGAQVKTLREFNPSLYKTNAERKAAFEAYQRGE